MKFGFLLSLFVLSLVLSSGVVGQDISGHWKGELNVQGKKIPLIFKISNNDNKLKATLDSPDQGLFDLNCDEINIDNNLVTLKFQKLMITYEGTVSEDGKKIDGTFNQGGMKFPLVMVKSEKSLEVRRPQTPKAPFNYGVIDLKIQNIENEDVKLAGTLTYPTNKDSYPLVILVSGSGAQDRDETIMKHKPFWVIADYLTKNGIAVFRFDDRGFGESTGNFAQATTLDFVSDVSSIVEYFSTDEKFSSIGVAGHSEGGLIAPMVASQYEEVNFVIMLAGPGIDGGKILVEQAKLLVAATGLSEEEVEKRGLLQEKLVGAIKAAGDEKENKKVAVEIMKEIMKFDEMPEDVKKKSEMIAKAQTEQLFSPWFKFFVKYDPYPTLTEIECPLLAINGDKDLQVPAKINLEKISMAMEEAGNKNYQTVELKGLNHLFQNCKTGSIAEYGNIEETFDPKTLELLLNWINKQTNK